MRHSFPLILLALLVSCSSSSSSDKPNPESGVGTVLPDAPNIVRAFELQYSGFAQEVVANGKLAARQKVDLKFQAAEPILHIEVRNGQRVAQGQRIASLDTYKQQSSLQQAQDNLERARLELQNTLIGQGYSLADTAGIPPEVMKIARVKSNYDNSLLQLQLAEYNLRHAVLHAPFAGVVANLWSKPYNVASPGEVFCTIIGNSQLDIDFVVLEGELPLIALGDSVSASPFAVQGCRVQGVVSEINPMVDKNGMVSVRARIAAPEPRVYDGMNVKVLLQRIIPRQLVIPKEALVLRSNKKVVFTLGQGRAQWVYVQTGLENSSAYVVTEGLAAGDSVIYEGNVNLAHEAPVRQAEAEAPLLASPRGGEERAATDTP